jgi:hypothetical protein
VGIPLRTAGRSPPNRRREARSHRKPSVDPGYPTEAHGRIPAFNTIEEEAAFWDTHSVIEFAGADLQPVEVTIAREPADRLTDRRNCADRSVLTKRARAIGAGPSTPARTWLKERLHQSTESGSRSS